MSRTAHHIKPDHWNITAPQVYGAKLVGTEHLGHRLYDLRFYAGCKREPQLVRRERIETSYCKTWGHYGGSMAAWAKIRHRIRRADERVYAQTVAKLANAGEEYDDLVEPEGRTRHSAFYDAW